MEADTSPTKRYYVHTFGCQMNESDSQRFSAIIESIDYQPTQEWKQADLVVFNTCSVKQTAEDRVTGMGNQITKLKEQNPELKVVLSGCMARRTWQGQGKAGSPIQVSQQDREQQLKQTLPWVDIVLETKDFGKLPQRLGFHDHRTSEEILLESGGAEHYLSFKPKYKSSFQAFVPISTGCDHFCTFCIVPFARGTEVCRSAESILAEVFNLVNLGYKDITLLGQTVNRWVNPEFDQEIKQGMIANTKIPGLNAKPFSAEQLNAWKDLFTNTNFEIDSNWITKHTQDELLPIPQDFLQLVQVLDQIPGEWWTTWVSSHPNYMTDQLIEFIGESANNGFWTKSQGSGHQRPYLHFALQSGSDKILKRMNRRYTFSEFAAVTDKMYQEVNDLSVSTDIIVGFPKETQEDVELTAQAFDRCQFDMAYISEFSPRKGTAAALIEDDIASVQKEEWKRYLNDEKLTPIANQKLESMMGTTQTVLVDNYLPKKEMLSGRTSNNKPIRIKSSDKTLVGKFVRAKIISHTNWAAEGTLISI